MVLNNIETLQSYKAMFQYFSVTHEEVFTKDIPLKSNRSLYKWISVAAVLALMLTVYTQVNKSVDFEDLPQEQQIAFNETVKGLKYLGVNLNKGSKNMKALSVMSRSINKGTEKVSHIGEFSRATNKILKRKNNK